MSAPKQPGQGSAAGAGYVREMFGRIAPRYDFLNHLLSLQADRLWRRRVARRFRHLLAQPGARVLDLCCGTADLTLSLARQAHPAVRIVGLDFSHPMLQRAGQKLRRRRLPELIVEADALRMPFPDGAFDLVTAAFGFRNLADYSGGLREIRRVLRRGGEAGILEFSEVNASLVGPLYNFYFRNLLPRIGGLVSGDSAAYRYLTRSVSAFPSPEELSVVMTEAGFSDVAWERFTGGIAYLHCATRE